MNSSKSRPAAQRHRCEPTQTLVISRGVLAIVQCALFVGALAHPGAAHRQEVGEVVSETVDVRVVNVDAVVVDKKGRPVPGLGPDDFVIFEDGRPVEITNFSAYGEASPSRTVRRRAEATSPPPGATGTPTSVGDPLSVAVYLDERGMGLSDRRRVFEDVDRYIESLSADGAQWILGSFRNRFEVLSGPTPEPAPMLDALRGLEPDPRAQEWLLAERRTLEGIRDNYQACQDGSFCVPCIDNWADMVAIARNHAASEEQRTTWTINGLADVIGTLSGLPGRKVVLYVGAGFEQRSGMATFAYLADLCEGVRNSVQSEVFQLVLEYDQTSRINELTAYANSNRVTLYMLDAAGVHPSRRASVEFADSTFAPSSVNDRVRRENFQDTHFAVAHETGGTAILNANRPLEALQAVTDEWTDATYSLGFAPPHPPSGRSHRLRVELVGDAAKGNRVRYRRSYLDKQLEAQLVDRLTSALFLERDANPLGVEVLAGEPERLGRNRYELPVQIRLPRDAFLHLPSSNGSRGQARLWMSAVSDRGGRSEVRQTLIDIDPPRSGDSHGSETMHTVVVRIELERGAHRLAVGIRDEIAQTESVVSFAVDLDREDD